MIIFRFIVLLFSLQSFVLDKDEIKIFSTLCQDGIFSIDEIIYNKSDKILIATFSRFCWEFVEKKIKVETFYRVVSGIRICNVNKKLIQIKTKSILQNL